MKRKFLSLIAAAAFFIAAAGSAQAEQVVVKQGDTLYGLSKQYGVSVESIKKWNKLTSDVIHPNDTLEVSPVKTVLVRSGDTLWNISQVYGVTVDNLMKWNSLSSDLIRPGLELTIYTDVHNAAPVKTERAQNVQNVSATAKEAPAKTTAPAAKTAAAQTSAPAGKEIMVEATAYTADCEGCIGITKTGVDLKANPNAKVIAVDPSVIPLGSKVYVQGYGYATAEDIGGAIKGNRIDVFIPEQSDALAFGRKQVKVTIVE
ncbi:LysM peptidoglycan-binding domain-containing protein [Mesobacillus foraminis]|uniref:3D domain-containing protein n=1 Tax=Mesobacillus foraminis TaxID=279826 RepID=UPI001BEC746C|nr:3D domain-containing protein [Mesobacillus foraminis]MBT2757461.1 LysM peptidoglycan-binding domain-containing protein [Mesobacillus foraminis]